MGVDCSCLFALYGHLPVTKKLRISIEWLTPFSFSLKNENKMKKKSLIIALSCISLVSVADNVGVNNVFGSYLLSNVEYKESFGNYGSNLVLSYENDKLMKITEKTTWGSTTDTSVYTFDYSKIGENKVILNCNEGNLNYNIEMTINEQGFVSKSYHSNGEWYEFTYNDDKRLDCMKQHHKDGEIEITYMTYTNGDLVKVEENDGDSYQIAYTSSTVTLPIENITGLMYECDWLWGIDFDEYNYVYMAGLLGVAPAHLPVSFRGDGDMQNFNWELDENGLPVECSFGYRTFRYYWETNTTGINTAKSKGNANNADYYNMSGQKVNCPTKGIYIVDGKKVVIK